MYKNLGWNVCRGKHLGITLGLISTSLGQSFYIDMGIAPEYIEINQSYLYELGDSIDSIAGLICMY